MKKFTNTIRLGKASLAIAAALCFVPCTWAGEPAPSFVEMVKNLPLIPAGASDSAVLTKVSAAVNFIKQLKLQEAQLTINEALQLDPRNSQLHFLNGFVYHLQARMGDTQKSELALEGYQQALRIDSSNWIAEEFLGMAYLDLKQFQRAKLAFSDVLLMTPQSAVSIYGLMVASYLTGDARTACAMADQFQKVSLEPDHAFIRSSVSVYASCGNFGEADRMRNTLSQLSDDGHGIERIDRRLAQWKSFYLKQEQRVSDAKNQTAMGMKQASLSQAPSTGQPIQLAQAFAVPSATYPAAKSAAPDAASPKQQSSKSPTSASTPVPVPIAVAAPSSTGLRAESEGPHMVLIDVVLLSTQELTSTSKGVNLLSALTLQLGSVVGNLAAFSKVVTASSVTGTAPSVTTAITRAVTVPALSYSLNIANANSTVNEVLARPTLAAIEGLPSEFFSGTNLSAGVVSTSTQGGTTIVPLDKRFGIKLAVTPTFLPQGRVQLKVEAQRTALNASSDNPRVAYQVEIGEITANANVVMNLGETLVLSGLSEKMNTNTRDGVPGLQDVPVVQYLFSKQVTNKLERSVLILITPRAPVQISAAALGADDPMADRMKALREKFGFTNSTPTNVDVVLNQLQPNEFFREFRQSDVSMEKWERMRTTGDRLQEALEFLYY